jgi:hypothetical protein
MYCLISTTKRRFYLEMEDDKSKNFKRLATNRTQKAIDEIRKIGNLSNTNNYSYTKQQIDTIFAALKDAIDDTRKRFPNDDKKSFTL